VVKIFIYSRIKKNVKRRGFDSLDLNFIYCCLVFQDVRIVLFVLLQEIKQIKNVNVGNN
jgi:chitinase